MNTVSLTLNEILDLAKKTLLANGCDDETASILAELIMKAERDGSLSHGLFRLPAYVSGLKSGKINGKGKPEVKKISPSVIKVLGNNCLAPVVLNKGIPELIKAAKENGVAVLAINNSHHMAAMWPETEAIAESGLVGLAFLLGVSFLLFRRLSWGSADVLGMLRVDFYGGLFQLVVAISASVALVLEMSDKHPRGRDGRSETVFLLLAGSLGAFFLLGTWNLLLLYLGFEGLGLAIYALAAVRKQEHHSAEAGIKALVYGSLSSGLMLYGISLLYGLGGSLDLREVGIETARLLSGGNGLQVAVPFLLILAGFGFKLAFTPFHFCAPDVYQGVSTPVLSFLAIGSKIAGAAAFLRVLATWLASGLDGGIAEALRPTTLVLATLAALTMLSGSLAALKQADIHRLLGWSSVAQGGFFLMGAALLGRYGFEAATAYLLIYGVTMLGISAAAFFLILPVAMKTGSLEDGANVRLKLECPSAGGVGTGCGFG